MKRLRGQTEFNGLVKEQMKIGGRTLMATDFIGVYEGYVPDDLCEVNYRSTREGGDERPI